ncbi:hypothetical protein [Nocardia asteroides]|uniref:hypothetical protein n=1 Tax=Nocardia asteroides TaxID=1824 RepID=UPI001E5B9959|nr:hypothetical protein [Nocardia asteroides]UGT60346.1 hypothetical protein LTT61_24575 [Nocardia asteroides]
MAALLKLPEAPEWRFRVTTRGANLDVEPVDLLVGWISGNSLPALADEHLDSVSDPSWRIEQMVDAVTKHFEHFLAWTIGALVELVNNGLEEVGSDISFCPELGGFIRYGVNNERALLLMISGIRSRRLAHAIIREMPAEISSTREDLRSWLASMGISEWREQFAASPSEVLDLLEFTRIRSRSLLKALLENGVATVNLRMVNDTALNQNAALSLEPARGGVIPQPIVLYKEQTVVAQIQSEDHTDVELILDTGLEFTLEIDIQADTASLRISLSEPTQH